MNNTFVYNGLCYEQHNKFCPSTTHYPNAPPSLDSWWKGNELDGHPANIRQHLNESADVLSSSSFISLTDNKYQIIRFIQLLEPDHSESIDLSLFFRLQLFVQYLQTMTCSICKFGATWCSDYQWHCRQKRACDPHRDTKKKECKTYPISGVSLATRVQWGKDCANLQDAICKSK